MTIPHFLILFMNLLCTYNISSFLLLLGFRTFHVVDFISIIFWCLFLLFLFMNYCATHDIESSLCFCNNLSILVLLQTNMFIFKFAHFTFIYGFWVQLVKSFLSYMLSNILFWFFIYLNMLTFIECILWIWLFSSLSLKIR